MYVLIYIFCCLLQSRVFCCFLVTKSCPTLWDIYYGLPGSSVHEISQTRILEWVAISFSRGSYQTGDQTCISCIGRQILYHWAHARAHTHTHTRVCVIKCPINRTLTPSQSQLQISSALDVYSDKSNKVNLEKCSCTTWTHITNVTTL